MCNVYSKGYNTVIIITKTVHNKYLHLWTLYLHTRVCAAKNDFVFTHIFTGPPVFALHRAHVTTTPLLGGTSPGRNNRQTHWFHTNPLSSLAPCEYFNISSKRQRFVSNKDTRLKEPTGTCWVTWWLFVRHAGIRQVEVLVLRGAVNVHVNRDRRQARPLRPHGRIKARLSLRNAWILLRGLREGKIDGLLSNPQTANRKPGEARGKTYPADCWTRCKQLVVSDDLWYIWSLY